MLLVVFSIIGGLALLIIGADCLVRGSSGLALRIGISGLVVGLTVVAMGTSAPELVVSLSAALAGNGSIALGNVLGSNIANIALILGVSALLSPIKIHAQLIRRDIPIMIFITVVLVIMLADHVLGRIEGAILFLLLLMYLGVLIIMGKREEDRGVREEFREAVPARPHRWILLIALTGAGLTSLILGAHFLVNGAIDIAQRIGISDLVIGLTLVAVGTSLPELATSLIASLRQKNDIAVGNVVGSNIFNILCILGFTALISPFGVEGITRVDLGVLLLTALLLLPLMRTGFVLTRWEGALLVVIYFGYTLFLLH